MYAYFLMLFYVYVCCRVPLLCHCNRKTVEREKKNRDEHNYHLTENVACLVTIMQTSKLRYFHLFSNSNSNKNTEAHTYVKPKEANCDGTHIWYKIKSSIDWNIFEPWQMWNIFCSLDILQMCTGILIDFAHHFLPSRCSDDLISHSFGFTFVSVYFFLRYLLLKLYPLRSVKIDCGELFFLSIFHLWCDEERMSIRNLAQKETHFKWNDTNVERCAIFSTIEDGKWRKPESQNDIIAYLFIHFWAE